MATKLYVYNVLKPNIFNMLSSFHLFISNVRLSKILNYRVCDVCVVKACNRQFPNVLFHRLMPFWGH